MKNKFVFKYLAKNVSAVHFCPLPDSSVLHDMILFSFFAFPPSFFALRAMCFLFFFFCEIFS